MILADYHSCPCGLGYMGKEHLSSMHPSKWISMGIPVGIVPPFLPPAVRTLEWGGSLYGRRPN